MSARAPVIEDADFIRGRLRELEAERLAVMRCACPRDAYGFVGSHLSDCPLHPPNEPAAQAEALAMWAREYRP